MRTLKWAEGHCSAILAQDVDLSDDPRVYEPICEGWVAKEYYDDVDCM